MALTGSRTYAPDYGPYGTSPEDEPWREERANWPDRPGKFIPSWDGFVPKGEDETACQRQLERLRRDPEWRNPGAEGVDPPGDHWEEPDGSDKTVLDYPLAAISKEYFERRGVPRPLGPVAQGGPQAAAARTPNG